MGINPNQSLVRPELSLRVANHNQTIIDQDFVQFVGGLATNHNQTLVRPELSIRIANHNQAVVR